MQTFPENSTLNNIHSKTEETITIWLNIILAITCTAALIAIKMKPTPAGSYDFALGHTFLNQMLYSLTTTAVTVLQARQQIRINNNDSGDVNKREALWEHVTTATAIMLLQNSLTFITVTSVQQFVAVYFPFKLKVWVTTRRTKILFAAVYGCSVVFHITIFLVLEYRSLSYMKAISWILWPLTSIMVLMYAAISIKLISRVYNRTFMRNCQTTSGNSEKTSGHSRTTGNFHDKKTVIILLFICSGALSTVISLLVKQHTGYSLVVLITQYMQWIIASSIFVFVHRNVLRNRFAQTTNIP